MRTARPTAAPLRQLPKIYTLGFVALVAFLVMVSAYAVSESALRRAEGSPAQATSAGAGDWDAGAEHFDWYEDAALLICPLH